MPKVLFNSRLIGAGGVETHLLHLARLLVSQGAQVDVASRYVSLQAPLASLHREIPARLISTPFASSLKHLRLSTSWALGSWPLRMRAGSYDALYTTEISSFTCFLARFVKPGGRIVWGRAGDLPQAAQHIDTRAKALLHSMAVETPLQAEACRAAFNLQCPIASIPLLSHPPALLPRDAEEERARERGERELRVAFLGRFDRFKGVRRLLDLWPQLSIGAARLDFYGDGEEKAAMLAEIERLGLGQSVAVRGGWVGSEALSRILNQTDLVVLASDTEGLPLVLMESMAHGVPFVASDVGAIRTLAEENPDVRVVPLGNAELRKAIEEMAVEIRAGRISAQRLKSLYQSRYSYEVISRKWLDLLLGAP